MNNPEYAFNIYYSEEPNNGATYLHDSAEEARRELKSVYNDILATAEEEGMIIASKDFDEECGFFAEVALYDRIYDMQYIRVLTVNRIYE